MTRIPNANSPVEIRKAFQQVKAEASILKEGELGEILIGVAAGIIPIWSTELTTLTSLTIDNISIDGAAITSDTGAISFDDENLTTAGTVTAVNVTSGNNPGHTHTDIHHGATTGLGDDDHIIYVLANGSRALAGNWSLGGNDLTSVGLYGGVNIPVMNTFFSGTFQETFDATVTSDGATITMFLEQSGTGDLTMQFSDGYTTLDCTDPLQTIALTAGADDASPQANYIYIPKSTKVLTKSTSTWPAGEHIRVAYFLVPTETFVQNKGCYINQNWNDHLAGTDDQGHMAHMSEKLRRLGANWFSGVNANGATASYFTIGAGTVDWLSTSGEVDQLHEHTFPAVETSGSDIVLVVNQNGTAYDDITDLYSITNDNTGDPITNNRYFNLVFWGVVNKSGEFSALMVNLPGGFYVKQSDALIDSDGHDVYDIPREFSIDSGTAFLICRVTFQMGGTWTHVSTTDLRGLTPATAGGSSVNDHGGLGGLTDVADHPGYLLIDGSRTLTGNMAVDGGITIDGRDISVDGTSLDSLTNDSMADALHRHSELSASDGIPNPALQVDAAGQVGIGGIPAYKLDVRSTSVVSQLHFASSDVDSGGWLTSGSAGNFFMSAGAANSLAGWVAKHTSASIIGGGAIAGTLTIYTNIGLTPGNTFVPSERFRIDAAGLIGVGCTPAYLLDIRGSTSSQLHFSKTDIDSGGYLFSASAGNFFMSAGASFVTPNWVAKSTTAVIIGGGAIAGTLTIYTNIGLTPGNTFVPSERFRIDTAGQVGINATPDARLEIETGASEGKQAITIDQNDADKAFIDFQGTSAASAANNISTWTNATLNGFVRMEINGADKWIPYYNAPTS